MRTNQTKIAETITTIRTQRSIRKWCNK